MRFENKVMVITEAAQGIGKAVAEQVAREGARLALIDQAPYRITEIPHLVHEGKVKAYYIMGEDRYRPKPISARLRSAVEDVM
ncbi:MAG: SDR family NAD(P)-dependent oxidoreductase [Chania sp.]